MFICYLNLTIVIKFACKSGRNNKMEEVELIYTLAIYYGDYNCQRFHDRIEREVVPNERTSGVFDYHNRDRIIQESDSDVARGFWEMDRFLESLEPERREYIRGVISLDSEFHYTHHIHMADLQTRDEIINYIDNIFPGISEMEGMLLMGERLN